MHVKLEYQLSSGMRGRFFFFCYSMRGSLYRHVIPFAKIKIYDYSDVCVIYHGLGFILFYRETRFRVCYI